MQDLIYDFETLSNDSKTCMVVDVAWCIFDRDYFTQGEGYTFKTLVNNMHYAKFDTKSQHTKYGWKVNKETLDWWKELPDYCREKLKASDKDVSLETFCEEFLATLENHNIKYYWTRSNTFDPIIMDRIFETQDKMVQNRFKTHLKWWNVRDTRTWIDAKLNFPRKNGFIPLADEKLWKKYFVPHDAAHDVAADVLRLQKIARIEAGLE